MMVILRRVMRIMRTMRRRRIRIIRRVRLEVVRHLVTQHLDEKGGDYVGMARRVKTMMSIGQAFGNSTF